MKTCIVGYLLFTFLICSVKNIAQAPNFGTATGFALFTSNGAVTNVSNSTISGNIGTDTGLISGFGAPSTVSGNFYNQDDTSAQAARDLLTAYNQLFNTPTTIFGHTPAFGTETVTAGVYGIAAAGSVGGMLVLDAQGDTNAVFIFKFGGAFSVGAASTIVLANGTLAGNVYWIAEGAISMGASVIMKGTLIAHNGANSLGASSNLEGRIFSTTGAINTDTDVITKPTSGGYVPLPIELLFFKGICINQNILLKWSTATEINNHFFTIEKSENGISWTIITNLNGAINSSVVHNYNYTDQLLKKGNFYYRLKQTDLDGEFKYSPTIYIKNCGNDNYGSIQFYPNPTSGNFKLLYTGNRSQVQSTQIINALGEKVFEAKGYPTSINLTKQAPGLYYVRLHINKTIITKEILIKKD